MRLIGIDTPELVQSPLGGQAHEALTRLVAGKTVQLEIDNTERDEYGHLLAYVFVGETCVNVELLVREGMSLQYIVSPNVSHAEEYQRAQKEARRAGRRVWDGNHPLTVRPNCSLMHQKGEACVLEHGGVDSIRPDFLSKSPPIP